MMAGMRALAGEPEPVAHIQDLLIPGTPDIPARLYFLRAPPPLPCRLFHAGGWALGHYEDIDTTVRALANVGCAILSVNYRLAPEHKIRRAWTTRIRR